jgi:RNA polymerase sigma-70 factor (ECF subfamily)
MPETDASLVLAGNPAAFTDLLRRHGQAIHAYLARRAGRDAADDLLGEVWLRAYAARQNYDEHWPDARPWLYGIARNVLREHWRHRQAGGDPFGSASEDPWFGIPAGTARSRLHRARALMRQLLEEA